MLKLFLLLVVACVTVNALFTQDVLSQVRRNIHTRKLSTRKSQFIMPRSNVLTNFTQRVDNFNPANLNTFEQVRNPASFFSIKEEISITF